MASNPDAVLDAMLALCKKTEAQIKDIHGGFQKMIEDICAELTERVHNTVRFDPSGSLLSWMPDGNYVSENGVMRSPAYIARAVSWKLQNDARYFLGVKGVTIEVISSRPASDAKFGIKVVDDEPENPMVRIHLGAYPMLNEQRFREFGEFWDSVVKTYFAKYPDPPPDQVACFKCPPITVGFRMPRLVCRCKQNLVLFKWVTEGPEATKKFIC